MLDAILADKRREVADLHEQNAIKGFESIIRDLPPTRSLRSAITCRPDTAIIAEIKRQSPSKGPLRLDLDPAAIATLYEQAGATAISVLTDQKYFAGSLDDLRTARRTTSLPILRKDFIIDEIQLYEARANGADAALLIVAALDQRELVWLIRCAGALGLEALVEVHTEAEARRAIEAGAVLIGINNRDLHTFNVSLETAVRIRPLIPSSVAVVAESGIHTRRDIDCLRLVGIDAVLIGESIITAENPAGKIRQLLGRDHDSH
jgi:indole-3-glycerol phosphate synthase